MAIGVNWAEVWKPVWKDVWTDVPPEPPTPSAGLPGIDLVWSDAKTPKWWAKSGQGDEKPEPVKAPKKPRAPSKAREEAERVIREVAAEQIERGNVPKSVRFAEVRSQIKPFGRAAEFNWPALYQRVYDELLTRALQAELAREDQIQDDELAVMLLMED